MKFLLMFTTASLFTHAVFAQVVETGAYVYGEVPSYLKDQVELTLDHISTEGFEIYGPHGLDEYLAQNGLRFEPLEMNNELNKGLSLDSYPSFKENERKLKKLVEKYSDIATLFSIGKSVEGRDLWVVKISDNPKKDEKGEPEFKYISSMHGDEITGREVLMLFLEDFLSQYKTSPKVQNLVNNTEIFIMPSMNPDGSEVPQRGNANSIDLNRDFPDWIRTPRNVPGGRQPETQAVMKFQAKRKFSMSANFHGGALVVNYPWDNTYDAHPLENMFINMSLVYSKPNSKMYNQRRFRRGITNGADWYLVYGGMQDWSLYWYNDFQVTVEISQTKYPSFREMPQFYKENRDSLVNYLAKIHQGFGLISKTTLKGKVRVKPFGSSDVVLEHGFTDGEFYTVLPKGKYQVTIFDAKGAKVKELSVTVADQIGRKYVIF